MSTRLTYSLSFLVIASLLLFSVYLEHYAGVIPCPLCNLQRMTFCLLGILFFFAAIFSGKMWSRLIFNSLISIASILGMVLAGRQIWIQYYPTSSNSDCSVGLHYMLEMFPVNEVIYKIFVEGGGECSQRGWEFLDFSMAEWAFIWFFLFFLSSLYLFLQEIRNHHNGIK
jgi:disulfide bond formation protein DsbB